MCKEKDLHTWNSYNPDAGRLKTVKISKGKVPSVGTGDSAHGFLPSVGWIDNPAVLNLVRFPRDRSATRPYINFHEFV